MKTGAPESRTGWLLRIRLDELGVRHRLQRERGRLEQ
jgi:hypothetical protein